MVIQCGWRNIALRSQIIVFLSHSGFNHVGWAINEKGQGDTWSERPLSLVSGMTDWRLSLQSGMKNSSETGSSASVFCESRKGACAVTVF